MVFRAVVFTFVPTAIELVLVCGLLARTFAPAVASLVVATFIAYVLWTASLTRAAAEARRASEQGRQARVGARALSKLLSVHASLRGGGRGSSCS
jgi:ABC-type transport system involved in Fe-S cluster assembly fused permease/ATPase subunit